MSDPAELTQPAAWAGDNDDFVDLHDLRYLFYLPLAALVAWFVPDHRWDDLCRRIVRIGASVHIGHAARRLDAISRMVEGCPGIADPREFVPALTANSHRARLHILRCYRRPPWTPELTLVGGEYVGAALAAGRGVILWIAPFVFSDLLTKMAFHRAGFAVAHLSRRGHGFSETRFGSRMLNPIWTTIEDRYQTGRLMISADNPAGALRELVTRVRRNQIVSVTVGNQGQRASALPFFNGTIPLAGAIAALALRTQATLLPVFTVRQADGRFVTTIEPPLTSSSDPAAGERMQQLLRQESRLLESWVRRYPDQFIVWGTAAA
jgi:lauroyl/myristoyl acyltransferase